MKNIFKILLISAVTLSSTLFVVPQTASADFNPLCPTTNAKGECTSGACQGQAANSPACQQASAQGTKNPIAGPDGIINKAASIIAIVAGIGAVIMILIGGFFYVTSAGNQENAKKAKARIISAFIGLVVVALAWALVRLITDRVLQ